MITRTFVALAVVSVLIAMAIGRFKNSERAEDSKADTVTGTSELVHPRYRYEKHGLTLVRSVWFGGGMVQYDANFLLCDGLAMSDLSPTPLTDKLKKIHGIQKVAMDRYELHLYSSQAVPWSVIMPEVVEVLAEDYMKANGLALGTNAPAGRIEIWTPGVSNIVISGNRFLDPPTYTVNVADGLWVHTNVIRIKPCSEFCTALTYVDDGVTNDFHAAFTKFTVRTNGVP